MSNRTKKEEKKQPQGLFFSKINQLAVNPKPTNGQVNNASDSDDDEEKSEQKHPKPIPSDPNDLSDGEFYNMEDDDQTSTAKCCVVQ